MHLVLLICLLVNLLLKVESSGLLRLYKGHEEMPTLEKDLLSGLLCGPS